MSSIKVGQIKTHLIKKFDACVDMADYAGKQRSEQEAAFLSRSLAAFAIMHFAGLDPKAAGTTITDGYKDNGIDALHYHEKERVLYIVQSKWDREGRGSLKQSDASKVCKGVRDLFKPEPARFNSKIQAKWGEVEKVLLSADSRVVLVIIYNGQDPISAEVQQEFDDLRDRMNDGGDDMLGLQVLRQNTIHGIIASGASGAPLNLEVGLSDWGSMSEPYKAYYGRIAASEIAQWDLHHPRVFAPNLRMFLGATDINQIIMETLKNEPERFWYCNNGITVLCGSVKKKIYGGGRDAGLFECQDVTIVNGAQTVGAIVTANQSHPEAISRAFVQVKFISLEHCPDGFAAEVTRATNTQNRIERRDFVTLDEHQGRIRTELALDGVDYVFKSGEKMPAREKGFDLVEATLALACSASDVALAVLAKREIGRLWEDIDREPYRTLFNSSTSSRGLWSLVQILRVIEDALDSLRLKLKGRTAPFSVHGNRFTAHLVYRRLALEGLLKPDADIHVVECRAAELTNYFLPKIHRASDRLYPEAILSSLFKNLSKCREIYRSVWSARMPKSQYGFSGKTRGPK